MGWVRCRHPLSLREEALPASSTSSPDRVPDALPLPSRARCADEPVSLPTSWKPRPPPTHRLLHQPRAPLLLLVRSADARALGPMRAAPWLWAFVRSGDRSSRRSKTLPTLVASRRRGRSALGCPRAPATDHGSNRSRRVRRGRVARTLLDMSVLLHPGAGPGPPTRSARMDARAQRRGTTCPLPATQATCCSGCTRRVALNSPVNSPPPVTV